MYVVHGMIDYTRKIISRNVWTVKIFWKVWWIFFQVWNRADIEEPNKLSVYDNSNITVSAMAEEQKKIRGKISDCELLKLYSKWPELYRKECDFIKKKKLLHPVLWNVLFQVSGLIYVLSLRYKKMKNFHRIRTVWKGP